MRGDAEGFCDGFDIEILIESDEDPEVIAELIRLSRQLCFTEKALMGSVPVKVRQQLNQKTLEV